MHPLINRTRLIVLPSTDTVLPPNWGHRAYVRPFNALFAIHRGSPWAARAAERVVMGPGKTYLMPVGSCLDHGCDGPVAVTAIRFRLLLRTGQDLLEGLGGCHPVTPSPAALQDLLGRQRAEPGAALALQALILQAAAGVAGRNRKRLDRLLAVSDRYAALFEFLDHHLSAQTTVAELAGRLGLTPASLSLRFRRETGGSLKRLLLQRLMEQACDALLLTDRSVKEVAAALGYRDADYFCRAFRRHHGLTPTRWRETERGRYQP